MGTITFRFFASGISEKISRVDTRFPDFFSRSFFRITSHGSSCYGSIPILLKLLGIAIPGDLGGGGLSQHGEDQLKVAHVIPQVVLLLLQSLNSLYSSCVMPKVARLISAVRMEYSTCSFTLYF